MSLVTLTSTPSSTSAFPTCGSEHPAVLGTSSLSMYFLLSHTYNLIHIYLFDTHIIFSMGLLFLLCSFSNLVFLGLHARRLSINPFSFTFFLSPKCRCGSSFLIGFQKQKHPLLLSGNKLEFDWLHGLELPIKLQWNLTEEVIVTVT